jgi:ubiquitin carboxyl-terminal hydrolase L3
VKLGDGDLKNFLTESATMDAEARGELLLKADGIANIHKELALTGQSEAPEANVPVNFHFVAFVHRDGGLYELGNFSFAKNDCHFLIMYFIRRWT